IGKYGQMRLEFLKKHRRGTYTTLLTEARLTEHLHEIDETARAQISEIMSQQATSLGVTEQMKAENPMTWAQMMNNIKASAEETVLNTLIYT
ncbi:MAG: TnpV protein, partial [Clostridia bacterium]|nr:TnpV protein [Clostridia bacterium]